MTDTDGDDTPDDAADVDDLDIDEIQDMSIEDLQAEAEPGEDVGFDSGIDTHYPVDVPLEKLTANNWNPNEMSSEEFNRLCENIEDDGFLSALQAVPVDDGGNNLHFSEDEIPEDPKERAEFLKEEMDHARIVGGEHRWSAAKVVGMTELPVNLVPNKDEEWEKLATVRMNAISGSVDPVQFAELVEEQRAKYDDSALKHKLGYAGDDTLFDQVLEDVKESVPEDVREEIEENEEDLETIEDLSSILNRIFRNHGDQLDYHFITFAYGGEDNVMYKCDDKLWARIMDVNERLEEMDASAIVFWRHLLQNADLDASFADARNTADVISEDGEVKTDEEIDEAYADDGADEEELEATAD